MGPSEIQKLAREVIRRLAPLVGADGRRGAVICVCTGATVAIGEAMAQLSRIVLEGYSLRLVLTDSARELYGDVVERELYGLPCVTELEPGNWLNELRDCRAVAVPMLSVNTLSMLSSLLASGVAANLLLHGLFMGKPMAAAVDGACPDSKGRELLGFDRGAPVLEEALRQRLRTVAEYGCRLCLANDLGSTLSGLLAGGSRQVQAEAAPMPGGSRECRVRTKILTAGEVRRALSQGCQALAGPEDMMVTALAKDEAQKNGLNIITG